MAFAPSLAKKKFENLSVEELEKKYEEIKKNYTFETKEEQIEYMLKNYLNASLNTNNRSTKIAIEELLKEKTGKEYAFVPKYQEYNLKDVIDFISKTNVDSSWSTVVTDFFNKIEDISEKEKIVFLFELMQDKTSFNAFINEISESNHYKEIYDKYKQILKKFMASHIRKG